MEPDTERKILIVTSQALPQDDRPATGGGLRAYALGEALKGQGHTVSYSIPRNCCEPGEDLSALAHSIKDVDTIIEKAQPDIVLFCNWGLAVEALECELPTVIDMNGPLILENYYRKRGRILEDSLAKIEAVSKADYLIAGSQGQKNYLTSWCLLAGFKPENIAIGIVPFSLSPDRPINTVSNSTEFILAGYNWPWLEGSEYLQTICDELEKQERGILHVYSAASPYVDIFETENSSKDDHGKLQSQKEMRLVHHEPVSFQQLSKKLSGATIAIDLWKRNPERELAIPSRVVSYLWAGLPVITSNYGELSSLIQQYNAGWIIEDDNLEQLRQVVDEILTMPAEDLDTIKENAHRAFLENFCWGDTIGPLDRFCRNPRSNRASSSLTAKHLYYQQLSGNLQDHVTDCENHLNDCQNHLRQQRDNVERLEGHFARQEQQIEYLQFEADLRYRFERKPQGFALLGNPKRVLRGIRRVFIGLPLLIYLAMLTLLGHSLHVARERLGRL